MLCCCSFDILTILNSEAHQTSTLRIFFAFVRFKTFFLFSSHEGAIEGFCNLFWGVFWWEGGGENVFVTAWNHYRNVRKLAVTENAGRKSRDRVHSVQHCQEPWKSTERNQTSAHHLSAFFVSLLSWWNRGRFPCDLNYWIFNEVLRICQLRHLSLWSLWPAMHYQTNLIEQ